MPVKLLQTVRRAWDSQDVPSDLKMRVVKALNGTRPRYLNFLRF